MVKLRTFSRLRQVVALSNAINSNAQPVYPVTSNTLVKKEGLDQILRWHTTSNKIIPIIWLYIKKQSPIELILKPLCSLD